MNKTSNNQIENNTKANIYSNLRRIALKNNFPVMGVCRFTLQEINVKNLLKLARPGMAGTMEWLTNTASLRAHPKHLWPECKSVIILGVNYTPDYCPISQTKKINHPNFAVYSKYRDYHRIIKKRLKAMVKELKESFGGEYRHYVDTAPIAEKPLAMLAGIGWQGKHTNLVSREYGSWLLLSVVLSNQEFPTSNSGVSFCGTCKRCQTSCPTDALDKDYKLKITSCLSYLTIEHKGTIPKKWRSAMGNRIFGCDDCLSVCPWNKFAKSSSSLKEFARNDIMKLSIANILTMTVEEFSLIFHHTPIQRLGLERLHRNALVVAGNSNNKSLLQYIKTFHNNNNAILMELSLWAFNKLNKKIS